MPKRKRLPTRGQDWTRKDYIEGARQLREAGFNVSYKGNRKNSKWDAAAVRRLMNQRGEFVHAYTEEHRFKFQPLKTRAQREKWKTVSADAQFTPNGVFYQYPKGVDPNKVKPRFNKDGDLEFNYRGPRGGKRRDVIRRLDPAALALDPLKEIKRAVGGKKPKHLALTVRGHQGKNTHQTPKDFFAYFKKELLPQLTDPNRKGGPLSNSQIADIFSVKMIY